MKKQVICFLTALAMSGMMASCQKYSAKTVTLNNLNDSINYAVGYTNGDGVKNFYMTDVDNQAAAVKAFVDALDKAYNSETTPDEMYKLGTNIGTNFKQQERTGLMGEEDLTFNIKLVEQGFAQGLAGTTDSTAWSPEDAQRYIQETMMRLQAEKAAKARAEETTAPDEAE